MEKFYNICASVMLFLCLVFNAAAQEKFSEIIKAGQEKLKKQDFSGAAQNADSALKAAANPNEKFAARKFAAQLAERMKDLDKARSLYAEIAGSDGATLENKIDALSALASTWNSEKKFAEAREEYLKILSIKELSDEAKFKIRSRIADTYYKEENLAGMKAEIDQMLKFDGSANAKAGSLSLLGSLSLKKSRWTIASEAFSLLASIPELDAGRRYNAYKNLFMVQHKISANKEEKDRIAAQLEKLMAELAAAEKSPEKERLCLLLQAAGVSGLRNDFKQMDAKIDEALKKFDGLELAAKFEAFQDAALFYMLTRDYEVVSALKARGDTLLESAKFRNTYTCKFLTDMPEGARDWAQSEFIKDKQNKDARFQRYPKDKEMLLADVAAERPMEEKDKAAQEGRETFFSMAYDAKGWHIYVQSNEPDIEKIMAEDGKGGSSLEMFFAPGLEAETYYQWIIKLATKEINFYHWNTPHRFYRYLENEAANVQTETAILDKGWGTMIFIPWECLYDKLPFMERNQDTWRFTVIRWGPASLTWSGRVHETGRWGQIRWQAPTTEQRLAIEKNIIKKAWARYQSAKSTLSDYWQGACGDIVFYRDFLEPVIKDYEQYGEKIKDVDKWDLKTADEVFRRNVPDWMEFRYKVEELRSDYLNKRFFRSAQND